MDQIRAEYEAAIPDEIKEKVQAAVSKELVSLWAFLGIPKGVGVGGYAFGCSVS